MKCISLTHSNGFKSSCFWRPWSEEALKKPDEKPLESELEEMADDSFESKNIDPDDELAYMSAELDVYEMFAKKHCAGRVTRIKLCEVRNHGGILFAPPPHFSQLDLTRLLCHACC